MIFSGAGGTGVLRKVTWMIAAALLGVISACSSPPSHPPASPPPAAGPVVKAPPPRPEPPPRRPAVTAPANLHPEQLTGLSQDETQALLGPPAAEAVQAMATVWTYRRGGCALSLVFYPEVETAVQRVLSYEFKGSGEAAACLNHLREARIRNGK